MHARRKDGAGKRIGRSGEPAGRMILGNTRAAPRVEHASLCSTRQWIMAARANWKGVLKAGEVSCAVALYTAASTAERIAFHILNRKAGHRVHREFVDAETGERVEAKEQVKGYETGPGDYIAFEPEEIAKAVPEADKTLDVEAFVPCGQVDDVYFDRPYYLAPRAPTSAEAFALIRDVRSEERRVGKEWRWRG